MNKQNRIILILFFLAGMIGFAGQVQAAIHYLDHTSCGCNCNIAGDTYILTEDMDCDTDGLIVGADEITIDGGGYTIGGDGDSNDYGIDDSTGYDTIIIQNFASITNFYVGIYFDDSTGSTIQNNNLDTNYDGIVLISSLSNTLTGNIANSNSYGISMSNSSSNILTANTANLNDYSGINISSSASNTLTNNITNSNHDCGISLESSSSNTLTSNTAASNSYGIHLKSSTLNVLSSNTMYGNSRNLHIYDDYSNTINIDNLVEGKPVYYLYGVSNQTYDGDEIGDIGMFWCISCNNVTFKNATLSNNNYCGVYLYNTTNSTIQNITANSNFYGIRLNSSSSNTFIGNTVSLNYQGIYSYNSSSNIFNGNTISFNGSGIVIAGDSPNTFINNTVTGNENGSRFVSEEECDHIIQNNRFSDNVSSSMISFTEIERIKNVNDTISFTMEMKNPNGTNCNDCDCSITTSPRETITMVKTDNEINGSFTANKSGLYSMVVNITDSNQNIAKRKYCFYTGPLETNTMRYYLRGLTPDKGQPAGSDAKSLSLEAPSAEEYWFCGVWVQNSPDEIPYYPLACLNSVSSYTWYKQLKVSGAYIGVERYVTYGSDVDFTSPVSDSANYIWTNENFTDLDWAMDYSYGWYWIALKLFGSQPYWITFPEGHTADEASYADFTYQYTTTPAIKSISDENIMVLSATADPSDTGIISVVLEDSLTSDTSTMDIVLSSSVRIDLSIDAWNTTTSYYKQWREEASGSGIIGTHIISGFAPNSYYVVKKNSALVGLYMSDNLGKITFTCLVGSVFTISQTDSDDDDDYQCFLTTLFGTVMAKDEDSILCKVRDFRDSYLLTNPIGKLFVNSYYKISPTVAGFISEHPILKSIIRRTLTPLIWMSEEITE